MFKNSSGTSSSTIAIVNCVINVPLMLAAIFGNTLVLTAILTSSFLRSSPSMILLCGLAVSDLAVGLIVQPLFIAKNLALNSFIDTLYGMMATALCGISLNTMVMISVDRVLALRFHMSYSTVVTSPRVIVTMILSWLFHFLFSCSNRFFNWKVQFCVSCVLVGIYSIVAATAYIYIYRIVRRHQLQIHIQQQAVQGSNTAVTGERTTVNTFIFYIFTCFCYLPWLICRLSTEASPCVNLTTLIFANSAINPLLFCWRLHELRTAVKNLTTTCHQPVARNLNH